MLHDTIPRQREIRIRLLLLLSGALVFCFCLFILIAYLSLKSELYHDLDTQIAHARQSYALLLKQREEVLRSNLHQLLGDRELRQAFVARNRKQLLEQSAPIFGHLFERHKISHLYFHTPEGVNFLRVHQPDRYGDRIERYTLRTAQETLDWQAGLELGPLGTFTLRVVAPWFADGELLGFIELGEEFEPILSESAHSGNVDMLVLVSKRFVQREGWEDGMRMLGREGDWGLFPDVVAIDETRPGLARVLRQLDSQVLDSDEDFAFSDGSDDFIGRSVALRDVAGTVVGRWYLLRNIDLETAQFRRTMGGLLLLCVVVGAVLIGIINRVLRGVEERLRRTQEGLEQLVADRTDDLQKALIDVQISREQIRVVLKALMDPILVVAGERLWLANRSARELFQLGDGELSGKAFEELFDRDTRERLAEILPGMPQGEVEVELEVLKAGKPETRNFAVQTTTVFLEEDREAHIFLFHDVTRARQMEKLKGEFISNTAHELNTPLATIMGYSELLLDPDQQFPPEMRQEFVQTIFRKANHLNRLVAQILDIGRLEAGRPIPLEPSAVSLQETLQAFYQPLSVIYRQHRFNLELPEAPVIFWVDDDKFQQILENLVGNAVKYSPEGGKISIRASLEEQGMIHFAVSDEGVGMSMEEASHVFERFYRVDASDAAVRGVGLGLTITRQLVEAHGGRIWIESRPGTGTTVHFTLPLESPAVTQVDA